MIRIALLFLALLAPAALPAQKLDLTPRTAIVSAFPPEWVPLTRMVEGAQTSSINGVEFVRGTIAQRPVLLFLSGVSMVNAAMTMQLALDRFTVKRIVFSGVAGGIDPKLDVGDVVVPTRWAQYLESAFARETPQGFAPLDRGDAPTALANYGMIFPRSVMVRRAGAAPERRVWFPADPALLAIAKTSATRVTLARCHEALCLRTQPRIIVGGNGISGPVFMDNAAFRAYAFRTFDAQVLDMESAAVAHVAFANAVPFIAFRSLSDLAGGDPGENQARAFYPLASTNSALVVTAFLQALPD
jgi:adenosylhomocysteine nucleosidase